MAIKLSSSLFIVTIFFVVSLLIALNLYAHHNHNSTITSNLTVETNQTPHKQVESRIINEFPHQKSKNAYVTLISGIDKNLKYRGFLYNALIMRKALTSLGSTADFIAMIGYSDSDSDPDHSAYEADINLLVSNGILIYNLPRFQNSSEPLSFAEMALLKITPWSFLSYERIQFLDGDVMPTKSLDCYFSLSYNSFTVGAASPLNSGWFLAIPNQADYDYLRRKALWRLACDWDAAVGWREPLASFDLTYRGEKKLVDAWTFNGADMDQGLFTHYFLLNHGQALLIDTDTQRVRQFTRGLKHKRDQRRPMKETLRACQGLVPTSFYAHFTGKTKPWVAEKTMTQSDVRAKRAKNYFYDQWMRYLDSLGLPITSSNVHELNLGSPLGYYNVDMYSKKKAKCWVVEEEVR